MHGKANDTNISADIIQRKIDFRQRHCDMVAAEREEAASQLDGTEKRQFVVYTYLCPNFCGSTILVFIIRGPSLFSFTL